VLYFYLIFDGDFTMNAPINFKMIAHPLNWVVVLLMVIIAGAIGHYTLSLFGIEANMGNNSKIPANGQVPLSSVGGSLSSN
jgi:hypothetical protein